MGHDPVDDAPVCSTETRLIFRGIWKVHLSVTYPDSDFSAYHRPFYMVQDMLFPELQVLRQLAFLLLTLRT